ncbi:D-alpha,beta-D-heptose 1,7-bisphosphate phosphatase [Tenacibaculum skagerrakense]|uniref:D,D-heptose 1,7-bisphosphate phosphatase n=1 Tax=Tenacibaculum skagerrakense TaxID=186571 RepID=A0A4R2P2U0_9FLAO|nr:D-glycero-beta-D-manno-heptose 1,7-bisphosphate 7-phosphatase [Tenacibaculum skagerrakense]TCP28294.1 D-alpha,beta-D-heptose 1,7-bisphosphate phosphatase [Tenacibaculum skagerrakense]
MKVIFLDRDGVINKDIGYVHKIKDFEFIDGVFDSCRDFINRGFELIIITNQSGIGRGYYKKEDYLHLTDWMLDKFKKENIKILEVLFCPHIPQDNCDCRKPNTGMLDFTDKKYKIDKINSWLIGDKETDIETAINFGIKNTILINNNQDISKENSKAKFMISSIKEINAISKLKS